MVRIVPLRGSGATHCHAGPRQGQANINVTERSMLSHSTSSVLPWSNRPAVDPEAALLDLLGPVDGFHVLVIGPGGLGPMLALHQRGAASVTTLRAGRCVAAEPADAALIPRIGSSEFADIAIAQARRAIRPLNGLVVRLVPNAPGTLLQHTRRRLAIEGFSVGRPITIGSSIAMVAELPLYGRLACA
jgi:hypothetical protein